jgi:3-hydroxybutyryl-CoA dehydratase
MAGPDFPNLRRTVSAAMVAAYQQVNGDSNLIHYDAEAARAAGFERPIVHGGLTAAILAQACRDYFGRAWFDSGRLSIRFIRPLFVGGTVTTHGRVIASQPFDGGRRVNLEVWCANEAGEHLVVGEASGMLQEAPP